MKTERRELVGGDVGAEGELAVVVFVHDERIGLEKTSLGDERGGRGEDGVVVPELQVDSRDTSCALASRHFTSQKLLPLHLPV